MSGMRPMANPYAKGIRPVGLLHNVNVVNIMGIQSQHRVSNTKSAFRLASNSKKKRKSHQLTLEGADAFVQEKDCNTCRTQSMAKQMPGYPVSKKAHHPLCAKNTKTKGKGVVSAQTLSTQEEAKRLLLHFSMPVQTHEKCSAVHLTKATTTKFFAPRTAQKQIVSADSSSNIRPLSRPSVDFCMARGAPLLRCFF